VKLSVSLSVEDVAILDRHVERAGLPSRSAALHQAVRLLRDIDLAADYAAAWDEWQAGGAESVWEQTVADGVADAAR
jgi:Arc/MetJ-type ribon-helix-helix transcriptional regulator